MSTAARAPWGSAAPSPSSNEATAASYAWTSLLLEPAWIVLIELGFYCWHGFEIDKDVMLARLQGKIDADEKFTQSTAGKSEATLKRDAADKAARVAAHQRVHTPPQGKAREPRELAKHRYDF